MEYNIPYRDIINEFETACSLHNQIAAFDTGTIDFLDASSQERLYPYIFLRPLSATLLDGSRTLQFELYSLDQPSVSDGQNLDVVSNTEMYLYDLMAYFDYGPAVRSQVYSVDLVQAIPVNEAFADRLYGWMGTIDVSTPFALDFCQYPSGSA